MSLSTPLEKTARELLIFEESNPKYILGVEQNEECWWGEHGGGGGVISNPIFKKVCKILLI